MVRPLLYPVNNGTTRVGDITHMTSFLRRLPILGLSLMCASAMYAQMTQLEGVVKDENGQPLKDAVIRVDRIDMKGKWDNLKTKKKGEYLHAGLPLGTFKVTLVIDGKDVDSVDNVRTSYSNPTVVNFDLQKVKAMQAAQNKAIESGTVTQEMARDMSPEQKAALEKKLKEQSAAMAKNKALNDAFNAGMQAKEAKQWDVAAESFSKAVELDPKQHVIYGHLGEVYSQLATTKAGPERDAAVGKSVETYQKAVDMVPTDAGYRNNLALALARAGKMEEMEQQLNQAIQIDPPGAGRYYFNMGAVLANTGKQDAACGAFKKAIDADQNYADAYMQYGLCLAGKGTNKPDGTIVYPEGTAEAFQKFLQLKPDGPNAEVAKTMLASMGTKLETVYTAPGAKKPPAAKKK